MKKITLFALFVFISLTAISQSFPENFDLKCSFSGITPGGWIVYNPTSTPMSLGAWSCSSAGGRPATVSGPATPGVACSGVNGSTFNLDTSYLVTPMIDLTTTDYPGGHAYLRFDSKKETIVHSGRLSVIKTTDTMVAASASIIIDSFVSPVTSGSGDSTDWTTHQVDLSSYIGHGNFYLAFRYTSTTTMGTAWYMDNLSISTTSLRVGDITGASGLSLAVVGGSTASHVTLSCSVPASGKYRLVLYDMVGRIVYDNNIELPSGTTAYTIHNIDFIPGMYCAKLGNADSYGTTRLSIQ